MFKLFGKVGTIILSVGISLILFAVTFGIDISEIISNWIQSGVERRKERHEERECKQEVRRKKEEKKFVEKEKKAKVIKENRKSYLEVEEKGIEPEQIKINLNGRTIEEENNNKGRRKFRHEKDDLVPLGMEEKTKMEPDYIEGNLFKKEEEKKEEK